MNQQQVAHAFSAAISQAHGQLGDAYQVEAMADLGALFDKYDHLGSPRDQLVHKPYYFAVDRSINQLVADVVEEVTYDIERLCQDLEGDAFTVSFAYNVEAPEFADEDEPDSFALAYYACLERAAA